MFVLIWAPLLLSVKCNTADTSTSEETTLCHNGFCITLTEGEITAEAGLCVVISCSFATAYGFEPQNIVWFKCDPTKQKCSQSDMILYTKKGGRKGQPALKERMSLLEPDLSTRNCSIIINDLTESDSGSYQLRVNGRKNEQVDGFIFAPRPTVSVTGLTQKPTVMMPSLTEGQQNTLTCTAPGLCSGSDPKFTWTWRRRGRKGSHIRRNITGFQTEKLTAFTQRHSSTLTFKPSAEHHGTSVTCKVSFANNITTEETVTLNVTSFPKILKNSGCAIRAEVLTCVCISEGFPLPTIKWPLLRNHDEYSVITSVLNHTVNSTVTVKDQSRAVVECVSSSELGEVQQNITIIITSQKQEDPVQCCGHYSAVLPWAVAAVSLIVNVICIICVMLLWKSRKKVKPNREDRTYMSLQKTDPSPEYDVIGRPLN